jgi:HIP---CoA ligase
MFPYHRLGRPTWPELLCELSTSLPDAEAVVGAEGRVTFGQLADRAVALSAALGALGVVPGDRVGLLMPNGVRWMVSMLAAQVAGASLVPVNTWYRRDELAHVVARSRMRVLIADRNIFGHDFEGDIGHLERLGPGDGFSGTFFWPRDASGPEGLAPPSDLDVRRSLSTSPAEAGSESLLLFTSGSTAEPKAVPLLHGCLIENGFEMGERQHVVVGDRVWSASPLFFAYGCGNAVPVAFTHGAALCVQERFVPDEALRFIEEERCTVYYGLSPITRGLIASPRFGRHDISSLRTGTTGMSREDKRLAIEVLGISEVCSVYGLTEGYGHSTMTDSLDPLEVKLETQGTVLPSQQLRIVGDDGSVLPAGEIGEIQLRGCVTSGYFDAADLNAQTITDDGWFRTGDLAFLDDEGRLHFVGRLKELMKVNGINISPAEVEAVIARHPEVAQVFVFGVSDADTDESIGCVVVRNDGDVGDADSFARELAGWLRERTASYKIPRRVVLVRNEDLPLTTTGKVSKRLLQEQYPA